MQLCFFEDTLWTNFQPLTLTRPVDDLRIGILTMAEKWQYALDAPWARMARNELKPILPSRKLNASESSCWINSRFLPSSALLKHLQNLDSGTCIKNGKTIVAAHADAATTNAWIKNEQTDFSSMLVLEGQYFQSISNLWDLFLMNEQEIINDLERMEYPSSESPAVSPHAILENDKHIYIGNNVQIEAGAILIARGGPIFIGDGVTIMAGSVIRGPAAICEHSIVKMDAKIYGGTTVGPVCKVGGEIKNCIFHSYSNKSHDGFVGNSLFGQWCNLGADTNMSNLKNNYRTIRIIDWKSRKNIETGQQFLGTVMGDHTKTAINTQLNTGTLCGVSCNIFSNGFPPKLIPSFSWVGSNVIQPYKIDKALETMETMMGRRDIPLTDAYAHLMRYLFKNRKC